MAKKKAKFSWPVNSVASLDHWFARNNEAIMEITILLHDLKRKEANVPSIAHSFSVGMMLAEMGFDDHTIRGGLFHDGFEDTSMNERIMSWRYGIRAISLVKAVTEIPKTNSWLKRKKEMIERMINADPEAKVISACDKLDNLLSMCRALRAEGIREGEDCSEALVWKSFNRGYTWQKWYFQNITRSLVANLPDTENLPIVFGKLVRLVEVTFGEKFLNPKTRKLFGESLKTSRKE